MNLAELRGEVRRYLAETSPTASYFSNDDINRSINEGLKDMCIKADVFIKTHTITVVTGQAAYNLPWHVIPRENNGTLQLKAVLNHNNVALDPIPIEHIGRVYIGTTGHPLYYFISQVAITPAVWVTLTAYVVFPASGVITATYISPTVANGYTYEVIAGGTGLAAEPTWPVIVGNSVTDGANLIWRCREGMSNLYTLNLYSPPTTLAGGPGTYTIYYNAIDEGLYTDTDTPNIPPNKQHYLILYACFRCAMKAKNFDLAMAYITDYSRGLGLSLPTVPDLQGGKGATQS